MHATYLTVNSPLLPGSFQLRVAGMQLIIPRALHNAIVRNQGINRFANCKPDTLFHFLDTVFEEDGCRQLGWSHDDWRKAVDEARRTLPSKWRQAPLCLGEVIVRTRR